MKEKVSIIIPYDRDRGFLNHAIRSAEHQGQVILYQNDETVGYNINRALEEVKTPYWCILAEDDWLHHSAIKNRLARLEAAGTDFVHSYGVSVFPGFNKRVGWTIPEPSLKDMLKLNRICGGTTLYKTDLIDSFGGFDESLWTAEEYDFHLKLLSNGATLSFCPKETYYYRRHDLQKSVGNLDREYQRKRQELITLIRRRYLT
jgi:GT2 family glycosyltransferase